MGDNARGVVGIRRCVGFITSCGEIDEDIDGCGSKNGNESGIGETFERDW